MPLCDETYYKNSNYYLIYYPVQELHLYMLDFESNMLAISSTGLYLLYRINIYLLPRVKTAEPIKAISSPITEIIKYKVLCSYNISLIANKLSTLS